MLTKALEPLRWFAFIGLYSRERSASIFPQEGVFGVLAVSLVMLAIGAPGSAAQAIKLHEKTTAQGEIDRTP